MTDERWPGEDRLAGTKADEGEPEAESQEAELGPEVPEQEADVAPGEEELAEAEAEPAPPEEQLRAEEVEERRDGDTPVPDEAPAEEDELPRLRPPGHAAGELSIPDGYGVITGASDGTRRAVGIVVSRFNGEVTNRLLESALDELELAGVAREAVTVAQVPGAFALGCVIRGGTPHFDYVAGEAASGLQLAALETGIPVSFGVLTLDSAGQADERVGKGAEAVRTALEMADLFSRLRTSATA